jgi:hypothetical protein
MFAKLIEKERKYSLFFQKKHTHMKNIVVRENALTVES